MDEVPRYAELHCISNYSFLRGASFPEELVNRAAELGYQALAITDECSLAGVVRAHIAAKENGLALIIGSEFQLEDGLRFVLLATNRDSYGGLSQLITIARRHAKKGEYRLTRSDVKEHRPLGCVALYLARNSRHPSTADADSSDLTGRLSDCAVPAPPKAQGHHPFDALATKGGAKCGLPGDEPVEGKDIQWLADLFPQRTWIAVELLLTGNDQRQLKSLQQLSESLGIPLCACGDVNMHHRKRRILQDTLTAIRIGKPLSDLGYGLFSNGERHLRSVDFLQRNYPEQLLAETIVIAKLCRFSLDELRYEYPKELVPEGQTAQSWLRHLTEAGMQWRWPKGVPQKVRRLVEHELTLVNELVYEAYFLTVHDIVRYARERGILCQGRGSAANSAVCYCLGITEVDPDRMSVLFERFISKERDEPPDIDVDFEHERREEIIQYIYKRYSRDRAALAATVITYQPRSAVRDVGKALGLSLDQVDILAKSIQWWDEVDGVRERLSEHGFCANNPLIKRLLYLLRRIIGFPRHLSQHVGGFVISQDQLSRLVPIENAAMPNRTVIQWEKNDLEALGLLKIDVLALGMLTAIRKALHLVSEYTQETMTLADIPAEDSEVYAMIQKADTIGVFQIESRAQMTMLPRLRPKCFYDLVIEIAIIRPGPIQGDMIHPYLARRNGKERVSYPSEAVKKVLERTLGVPIFQEQVMQLSMVAAGFTAGEADQLRRCMAAWKRKGGLKHFEEKLIAGMKARGYDEAFAKRIVRQIQGFGEYGFPESHAASFALLAYASSWLKCYHPAAFTCALLNSQPMGFYAPSQLVQDARRHRVVVLPVDANFSVYDCTLETQAQSTHHRSPALRLGLRLIKGLSRLGADSLCQTREKGLFKTVQDVVSRAQLKQKDMQSLAAANAFASLSGDRHRAFWEISGAETGLPLFVNPEFVNPELVNPEFVEPGVTQSEVMLPIPTEGEDIVADYANLGLTLNRHPLALLRPRLDVRYMKKASQLYDLANGARVRAAGLLVNRQRPGTASGVIFLTLEDETGYINVVVWPKVAEQQRKALLKSKLLAVSGTVQHEEGVLHLIATGLEDLSRWLGELNHKPKLFF